MKDTISETKKTPSTITKVKDFMRTCFSCTSAQETRKGDDQDLAPKIQELQNSCAWEETIELKVRDTLKKIQDTSQHDKNQIKGFIDEGSLTSDHLLSLYKQSQKEVKLLIDAGVRHDDIELVDGKIALKGKTTEISSRDRSKDKQILAELRSTNKGRSITDTLAQVKNDQEVLDALTHSTVHYLEKALKLSPTDRLQFGKEVKDIYAHHDVRVSDAHTLYQYYDLQRRKDELKHMAIGKDKLCKQAYNILSLNACQNRRHKKEVTRVLEAEELRRQHLVEKYGNLKLEKGGKRGKEKRMLDDLIKARKEKAETDRAFELFNAILEKSERDIINNRNLNKDEREKHKDILKSARESFDRLHWNRSFSKINQNMEHNQIYEKHLIKKYGNSRLASRFNDVASDGGAIITVTGTVVGWTHVVPFVAA